MPMDAITTSALLQELRREALGAKIDRVQQPERELLVLTLRTHTGTKRLLLSASVSGARVAFTKETVENPAEPPMFCMLLRKHLVGAHILSIEQPNFERMLVFTLSGRNELGDETKKTLVCELIGRSANVILVGADGRIIDCLRRMDYGGDNGRGMQPGLLYHLPPQQDKTLFFSPQRAEAIAAAPREGEMDKWLLKTFSGLSPLICRELAYRCRGDWTRVGDACEALSECVEHGDFTPTLVSIDGEVKDYSFLSLNQYAGIGTEEHFETFSELLDAFYARHERLERRRRRSRELNKSVKTARDRLARKLTVQKQELAATADREETRKRAELITAYIYRIKKGMREVTVEDYFDESYPSITLPLDPLKTPQQNAAALYRDFSRQKAAEEHLLVLIAEGEKQLDYLESVLDVIERAESERDLMDIRRELTETGYLKRQRGAKPDRSKPQAPLRFLSTDGFEILVGRSNVQNDELTNKLARRTDLWLHTQHIHGSHVIVRCDGIEPPEQTIFEAATLAAYYSQGREAGKIPVDYTQVRKVRKPSGGMPGAALYTEYETIVVAADEALVEKLKK